MASEFLTLEGKQFSTSRKHVIYVQDIVARYGPDPIRYFICAAGPENQDADFSWAEFVQRNNSELVAGWGNLVNRTAAMIAKNFGEIPRAYAVEPVDEELLATVRGAFATVGASLERHRQKAALAEVMRVVGEANAYVSRTEPFKLKGDDQRERLVDGAAHAGAGRLGYQYAHLTVPAPCGEPRPRGPRRSRRVHADASSGGRPGPRRRRRGATRSSPASTPRRRAGSRGPSSSGRRWPSPRGVFVKLDPEQVIEDERARLGDSGPGGTRHHTDPLAAPKMGKPKGGAAAAAAGARADEAPTA